MNVIMCVVIVASPKFATRVPFSLSPAQRGFLVNGIALRIVCVFIRDYGRVRTYATMPISNK